MAWREKSGDVDQQTSDEIEQRNRPLTAPGRTLRDDGSNPGARYTSAVGTEDILTCLYWSCLLVVDDVLDVVQAM